MDKNLLAKSIEIGEIEVLIVDDSLGRSLFSHDFLFALPHDLTFGKLSSTAIRENQESEV